MNKSISETFLSNAISSDAIADFLYSNRYETFGIVTACLIARFSFIYLMNNVFQTKSNTERFLEYEMGYLEEHSALEDTGPDTAVLDKAKIVETTPFGTVIMTYSLNDNTFLYYADTRIIPYKTLDAVARQFAVKYSCKRICVNYKEEWEKAKARAIEEENKQKEQLDKKNDDSKKTKKRDIFAEFKNYNRQDTEPHIGKGRKGSIKRRRYRMDNNANRFTHKGRLDEYLDSVTDKFKTKKSVRPLSFAEFKAKK